ncbi:protein FAM210A [Dromiciops gliroides]|uniref:protein FAM210A n=1 Tax=Dromiciops gliroides TaxID=33562 RepID=UPI001CC56C68|nr:protein FAM210A [Dromiciops gliroides]XP_043841767.1 protein FAM210A [Dromiciops gliroides]XP_043841777.1 protein FAM210A [Dromiciops gliroides]XP_043841786.1 protein FAM210A [Dromiciops gliroides]XP_043841795.1 protein FAM210A [Dromiciops gliroides]XP_043841804.1 protein FAM210A [Dromiciops gliroides]XP_043841813.1 protein FAM210A [Dromiciops gliroides]XP_043841822.1 protein FAM210A [Dromiciops gliroides]
MQWNLIRTMSQLANRTCLISHGAGSIGHSQNIKGCPVLYKAWPKIVWVRGPQNHWLHVSSAQHISKERKPVDVSQHKQQKEETSSEKVTSSGGTAQGTHTERKEDIDPLQDKSISLYQRFKKTFRQYGRVLIPVHLMTSGIWFGTFYYAALKGVNVVPFLELIGLPDSIVDILKNSQSGNALTAYALFKIATPARYTVTLGGTSITVKYLRSHGYMSTPPPVKEYLQDRMEETKELITEKMGETKERLTEKLQETKEKVSFKKKVE